MRRTRIEHILSALPPLATEERTFGIGSSVPIVLQKSPSRLCEIEICNNRIGASVLLNRCCSFVPDLESMFRDQMQKILLQHNLPQADSCTATNSRYPITSSVVAFVWQRSVALDEATAARRAQPRAQRIGRFASIRRDPDAMPDRRVAHGRAHDERLTAAEDRLIFLLQLRVSGKRVALQTIADGLHRP